MRNPGGHAFVVSPTPGLVRLDRGRAEQVGEGVSEYDSFTCGHCGCVKHVRARERPEDIGGLCKQCMKLICSDCVETGRCDPLEKKLERAERRHEILRSYGF